MIRRIVITLGTLALAISMQTQAQAQAQSGRLAFSGVILEPTCVVQPSSEEAAAGEAPEVRLGTDRQPCRPARVVQQASVQTDAGTVYLVTYH